MYLRPYKTALLAICTLLIASLSAAANARSMVFEISRGGNTSYLGGTIHLLRNSDYPLPKEFEIAYQRSDAVVFETDLSNSGNQAAGSSMMSEFQLPAGVSTQSMLTPKNWKALLKSGRKVGFPVELYSDKHPVFHGLTLFRMHAERLGIVAGVDGHFFNKARIDGKLTAHLESVEAQMNGLGSLMSVDPNEIIVSTLDDVASLKTLLATLIGQWQRGDTKALTTDLLKPMREKSPEVYQSLMVDRNNNWLPQIVDMLETPEQEFILVGSAHLIGKHGLLKRLNEAGYRVRYFKP